MPAPRLSHGFLLASFALTAIMVHPGFASLLAIGLNLGLLAGLQRCARREGRRDARSLIRRDSVRS